MHVGESFVMVVYVLVGSPAIFVVHAPSVYSVDSSMPVHADTGVERFTTCAKRRATWDMRGRCMLAARCPEDQSEIYFLQGRVIRSVRVLVHTLMRNCYHIS